MQSLREQVGRLFGHSVSGGFGDLLGTIKEKLSGYSVQFDSLSLDDGPNGKVLCLNLSEGWGINNNQIVASGARPQAEESLLSDLVSVPGVSEVVIWDRTGRFVSKSRQIKEETSCTSASIPLWISVIVSRYADDGCREAYKEEFDNLEKALTEAGAPEDESLIRAIQRLSQDQIYKFYSLFRGMGSGG